MDYILALFFFRSDCRAHMFSDPLPPIRLREGFRGQVQYVMPRPLLQQMFGHPLLHSLLPTDIGWYPHARYHYRERAEGAPEHILIFCVSGAGWCELGGRRQPIFPGEALLIPAQTPHAYGAAPIDPWSIHWVHFAGLEADYFVRLTPDDTRKLSVESRCASTVEGLFHACYATLAGGFVLARLVYGAKLVHHLLAELFYNNASFSPGMRTSRFHSLELTVAFLHQNVHRPVSLAEMANHAELSESHFSRLFKEQTGHAPVEYFINLKMHHACTLLAQTQLTVRAISQEVGYADSYYFSRLFKKVIGMSPTEYRSLPTG
jgi:AraC family transcriptional regulator, arabinose operon regulatory protein